MILTTLIVSLLAVEALASPLRSRSIRHEKREYIRGWSKGERVRKDLLLPMRIGLKQENLERGYDLLMDVSRHDSPNYGKHYSAEEVNDIFAPSQERIDAVSEWLASQNIKASLSANKQWLQFDAVAETAEALLRTKFHIFDHESGTKNIACDEYHLPAHISEHVDIIKPGITLFATDKSKKRSEVEKRGVKKSTFKLPPLLTDLGATIEDLLDLPLSALCTEAITPACIKTMYNITAGTTSVSGNELGIFEDLGDYYSQTDLNLFFTTVYPVIPIGTHPTLEGIDGATAPTTDLEDAGPESDLDFQISYPIIYPQTSILFQTDDAVYEADYTYEGFFNNFLDAIDGSYCDYTAFGETGNSEIDPPYPDPASGGYKGALQCGVYTPTNVISVSYGGQEADLPSSYQERQCNEYMKLGLQGVSIVFASGDYGVGGPDDDDDNTDGCLGPDGTIFSPDFPATCPYLTTVGATYLPTDGDVYTDGEVAVTSFASGGGFSNIYPIPSYQASAVATYFADHDPSYPYYSSVGNDSFGANGGLYNRLGRGYPDVSAIGDNVLIYNAGLPTLIGGTSASAPTFASILTRINEERLSAGKSTIGFVNPTLYANPSVLHDITVGDNPGCGTDGFSAAVGWDPLTGLGTPNYEAMLKLFMSLD